MQAHLIDPFTRTIETVYVDGGLSEIYAHIKSDCCDVARLATGDVIYVTDDGLLGDLAEQQFFAVLPLEAGDQPHFLAGRALVVGTTEGGNDTDVAITLDALRAHVQFMPHDAGVALAHELVSMTGNVFAI